MAILRKLALFSTSCLLFAGLASGQTSSIEGVVKGEDGQPLKDALIMIERKDIKGNYKVKTKKKGDYFHAGLPLGMYRVSVVVNGKEIDAVDGVRTRLGDPTAVNFDLQEMKRKRDAMAAAAEAGAPITEEQARDMTPEQKAALEKQIKERAAAMAKNKALNDAFNQAMQALAAKQFDAAVEHFEKAAELDPKQYAVWANMADAYMALGGSKTGADQEAAFEKGINSYNKALELKPDDAAARNNFALALVKARKIDQAQAELTKAAELDPTNAAKYFYNLGAVLTNLGQIEPAGEAFKRAIESNPNHADAQYQYGVYLVSKATTTADGRIVPVPGTKEAFEKYLELQPSGPFADGAKGMLASFEATVQTEYVAPGSQKKGKKK